MSLQKLLTRKTRPAEPSVAAAATGPSPLAEQAQAFADVAHKAYEDCETVNAEDELTKRRNKSGQ